VRPAVWKKVLRKLSEYLKELRNRATDERYAKVRYTSVPLWRPWRDF
jgi:hypothetical protein